MGRDKFGRFGLFVLAVMVLLSFEACSAQKPLPPNVLQAGQIYIQLPPGWKVTHDGAVAPGQSSSGAGPVAGSATTTIPLAKQDPTTEFFQATSAFSSCLKSLGVKFIGAPDPKNPSSPANDPNYLKSLEKCAAQSNIVQALKDFQSSQSKLTPAQIQKENRQYLSWRTCMIGRGWTIPAPTPDSQGRLFSLGTGGNGGSQLVPPAGADPLTSPDIQACVKQSQLGGSGASA